MLMYHRNFFTACSVGNDLKSLDLKSWFKIILVIFDFDFKSLSWDVILILIWNHFISDISQNQRSLIWKWFEIKIKITCTIRSKSQSQGHNAALTTQHLCAKIQRNYAVMQCAKMHTDTQYSVTCFTYLLFISLFTVHHFSDQVIQHPRRKQFLIASRFSAEYEYQCWRYYKYWPQNSYWLWK